MPVEYITRGLYRRLRDAQADLRAAGGAVMPSWFRAPSRRLGQLVLIIVIGTIVYSIWVVERRPVRNAWANIQLRGGNPLAMRRPKLAPEATPSPRVRVIMQQIMPKITPIPTPKPTPTCNEGCQWRKHEMAMYREAIGTGMGRQNADNQVRELPSFYGAWKPTPTPTPFITGYLP